MFNANPILLRHLPPRNQGTMPILVGPKMSRPSNEPLPPLASDPWAQWSGPQPAASSAAPAAPRAVEGPIESRLAAQDDKIAKLQESLDRVSKSQEAMVVDATQRFQHIEKVQETNMQVMTQTIDTLRTDLDGSLKQVMQQSTQLFDARLQELKQLLSRGPKRDLDEGDAMRE